jgi:hypothetical protein
MLTEILPDRHKAVTVRLYKIGDHDADPGCVMKKI